MVEHTPDSQSHKRRCDFHESVPATNHTGGWLLVKPLFIHNEYRFSRCHQHDSVDEPRLELRLHKYYQHRRQGHQERFQQRRKQRGEANQLDYTFGFGLVERGQYQRHRDGGFHELERCGWIHRC